MNGSKGTLDPKPEKPEVMGPPCKHCGKPEDTFWHKEGYSGEAPSYHKFVKERKEQKRLSGLGLLPERDRDRSRLPAKTDIFWYSVYDAYYDKNTGALVIITNQLSVHIYVADSHISHWIQSAEEGVLYVDRLTIMTSIPTSERTIDKISNLDLPRAEEE